MRDISIIPLGGACGAGPASCYVKWGSDYNFLIDCGCRGPVPVLDAMPAFHKADAPADFVFISNAAPDCVGALPYVEARYLAAEGKIFIPAAIRRAVEADLLSYGARMKRSKVQHAQWLCALYSQKNIERILKERVYFIEGDSGDINGELRFRFLPGGAAGSLVELSDPRFTLLYACAAGPVSHAEPPSCGVAAPDILFCAGAYSGAGSQGGFVKTAAFAAAVKAPLSIVCHDNEKELLRLKQELAKSGKDLYSPAFDGEEIILRKGRAGTEYLASSSAPAFIVSTGTSLLRNFQEKARGRSAAPSTPEEAWSLLEDFASTTLPDAACAEINTLVNIKGVKPGTLCLLVSSPGSSASARLLAKIFLPIVGLRGYNIIVPSLDTAEDGSISDFVSTLFRLMDRYPMASIVASGGFKFQTALSYMAGTLMGRNVYYKHEFAGAKESLCFPGYPVKLDTQLYRAYKDRIEEILNSDWQHAHGVRKQFPPVIQNLLEEKKDGHFELGIMGVLSRFFCLAEDARLDRVSMAPGGLNPAVWDSPIAAPAAGKAPPLSQFRLPLLREFLLRVATDPVVASVQFAAIAKSGAASPYAATHATLELRQVSGTTLRYKLEAAGYWQDIVVQVRHPHTQLLIKRVGLEQGKGRINEKL